MHNFTIRLAILMSVATTEPTAAQSAMKSTFVYSDPSELQFSCAVFLNAQEEAEGLFFIWSMIRIIAFPAMRQMR